MPSIKAEILYQLGAYENWYASPKNMAGAIELFKKSIYALKSEDKGLQLRQWRGLGAAYHELGWVERSISDTELAIKYYRKYLEKNPNDPNVKRDLRKVIINLRNFKRAAINS